MRRIRRWSKTTWAIAISALIWVPVLLLTVWGTLHPPQDEEMASLGPVLVQLAFVGLGATFAILWLVFTVAQWVRKASFSRR